MAEIVCILCTLTSGVCAILLLRGYIARRSRLLLWSGVCFTLLGVANALLYIDKFLWLEADLFFLGSSITLLALVLLLCGLIWETA